MFETHVTADAGTGCVHTAPGHGYEDFQVGQRYGLPVLTPVDAQGRFTDEAGPYAGREVFATNDAIVADLRANGRLVHGEKLSHAYPHCWRSKNPLIFRATEQWFLRIDHAGLRETALGRDRSRRLGAEVGTRPHRQHDADAARLVPVAPARLGRADPRRFAATRAAASTPTRR